MHTAQVSRSQDSFMVWAFLFSHVNPGVRLSSSSLVTGTFSFWAMPLALNIYFSKEQPCLPSAGIKLVCHHRWLLWLTSVVSPTLWSSDKLYRYSTNNISSPTVLNKAFSSRQNHRHHHSNSCSIAWTMYSNMESHVSTHFFEKTHYNMNHSPSWTSCHSSGPGWSWGALKGIVCERSRLLNTTLTVLGFWRRPNPENELFSITDILLLPRDRWVLGQKEQGTEPDPLDSPCSWMGWWASWLSPAATPPSQVWNTSTESGVCQSKNSFIGNKQGLI